MNIESIKDRQLAWFLSLPPADSAGLRPHLLESSSHDAAALVKTDIDSRFSLILSAELYFTEDDRRPDSSKLLDAFGRHDSVFSLAGLFDRSKEEFLLADGVYDFDPLARAVGGIGDGDRIGDIRSELSREVSEQISAIANDTARRDEFAAFAPEDHKVGERELAQLLTSGVSPEEVLEEPIDTSFIRIDLSLAMVLDYIRDPRKTVKEAARGAIDENRSALGSRILHREDLAEALMAHQQHLSPDIEASRDILAALEDSLPGKDDGKVWITVARNGKSLEFQYPLDYLKRHFSFDPEKPLPSGNILPVLKRKQFDEMFGFARHDKSGNSSQGSFQAQDVVDIVYRKHILFQAPPGRYADAITTREVEVRLFKPKKDIRSSYINEYPFAFGTYESIDGSSLSNLTPDSFLFSGSAMIHVGISSSASELWNEAYRGLKKFSPEIGDAISMDGRVTLVNTHFGFTEAPFAEDDLIDASKEQKETELPGADLLDVQSETHAGIDSHDSRPQTRHSIDL